MSSAESFDAHARDIPSLFGSDVRASTPYWDSPPLFVEPLGRHMTESIDIFLEWLASHRQALEAALIDFGAVVFRGFPVRQTEDFERIIDQFPPHSMGYSGGAALRKAIKGRVMEATRISQSFHIQLHQEMSYLPNNPRLIAFFCRIAPQTGGATVIADMRRVTALLPPDLMQRFIDKGVRYTRNLLSPEARDERTNPVFCHNNWAANFGTDDRATVEQACRERGLTFNWRSDGSLDLHNYRPAVTQHPITNETIYFNQAHVQIDRRHAYGDEAYARMLRAYGDLPRAFDSSLGDGSPLSDDDLDRIYEALGAATVAFPWRAGDVMFVENKLTSHGREPFTGERDVQVALID
jgi:alpha-ketoglutarate-dependent taurine dioxygenase